MHLSTVQCCIELLASVAQLRAVCFVREEAVWQCHSVAVFQCGRHTPILLGLFSVAPGPNVPPMSCLLDRSRLAKVLESS